MARTTTDAPASSVWRRVLFVLVLALAFQGTRGIWEPDEGFYANTALGMLDTGDLLVPRLNGAPFLDKPPLVYWVQIAGVILLGRNEWGLRLGHALLFVATALLVDTTSRRIHPRAAAVDASLLYSTLPLTFLSANVLTPDTPLAFGLALALYGLVRLETIAHGERMFAGWLIAGTGFAVALLAKGPAALPFAAAALAHRAIGGRLGATMRDKWAWAGAGLALTPAVAWYLAIVARLPGAGAYVLDQQIVGRLFTTHLDRNAGWPGLLRVYVPTLLVGLGPWAFQAVRQVCRQFPHDWRERSLALPTRRVSLLLAIWTVLPSAVYFAASSRLPLYLLPLAAPIAVLAHLHLSAEGPGRSAPGRAGLRRVIAAGLILLAIKAAGSYVEHYRDSRGMAKELGVIVPPTIHEVISVDVNRNGLALYRKGETEWVTKDPTPYPFFSPLESFLDELSEIKECSDEHAFIVDRRDVGQVLQALTRAGQLCSVKASARYNPILLCAAATVRERN